MVATNYRFTWRVYFVLGAVFVCSVTFVLMFPTALTMQVLGGIPGLLALVGVLYQFTRDEAQHQKDLRLQQNQHLFDFGATSHMANVAFDKHVLFCEEYVSEMYATVTTLFQEGPTDKALLHAGNLYRIQQKHAAWLTPQIEKDLEPFEQALRTIGAGAHMYRVDPANANSRGVVDRMEQAFGEVLGWAENQTQPTNAAAAVATILERLRTVLGIAELSEVRSRLLISVRQEKPS